MTSEQRYAMQLWMNRLGVDPDKKPESFLWIAETTLSYRLIILKIRLRVFGFAILNSLGKK